jgi:hypothetical protein
LYKTVSPILFGLRPVGKRSRKGNFLDLEADFVADTLIEGYAKLGRDRRRRMEGRLDSDGELPRTISRAWGEHAFSLEGEGERRWGSSSRLS